MNDGRNHDLVVLVQPINNPIAVDDHLTHIFIVEFGTLRPARGNWANILVWFRTFVTTMLA